MKSHLSEKLYLSSPVWMQNLLVSVYGALEYDRRYGGIYKQLSQELFDNEFKSRKELDSIVGQRLNMILTDAIAHVPHYRSLNPSSPSLSNFPILNRNEVADQSERFVSEKYKGKPLIDLYTGGSSGTPLKVSINKDIRRKTYAFWNRFYQGIGFSIGDKKASFVGRKVQAPDNNRLPFWRYNLIEHQLVFSSYHMSDQNLPAYVEKLNKFKPALIEGYPLAILGLADYILTHKVALDFTPVGISTSSENFSAKQRKTLEQAFNCRVYDQYGSAESVVFASECEHGKKHISMEYGIIEILQQDGTIARDGEGELIVTTLLNDVMPLIRYRIGDLGKISNQECPCGRHTPILEELSGKVGAVIVTGDRRVPTAAIAIAFEYLENIKNAQIIQNEKNRALVKLVPKPGFRQQEVDFMIWELKKMLGDNFVIDVEQVEEIPPGENGKYQMVVQNYHND